MMTASRFDRFLPVSGIAAGALLAVVAVATWNAPNEGADAIAAWASSHGVQALVAGFGQAYVGVLLAFFAVALRQTIRAGEPGESTYSSAAFAGGLMVALSQIAGAVVGLSVQSLATDGPPDATAALAAVQSLTWVPWAAGSAVLFLAVGLGGLRTATLPRVLAIATVVLGVLSMLGPTGFAVYLLSPFWLVATGVLLYRRTGSAQTLTPAAYPTPA